MALQTLRLLDAAPSIDSGGGSDVHQLVEAFKLAFADREAWYGDPDYTEGGVGRSYLIEHNVPSEAIIVEPEGETTAHSIAAAGEIMQSMGLKSCILVSDGYHIFRAKKFLQAEGVTVFGSPRASHHQPEWKEWWEYFRQAVGFVLWQMGLAV